MVDALFPKMSKNFLNPLLAEKITGEESSSEKESLQYFSHSSTNQARPCLASKIRWDRARSGWCGHRLFSISNWTFSLLGNSKCHWDCVGTSFIQRYGNDLDELWNTHHVPSFSVSWRGNRGGGKEKRKLTDSEGEAILVGSLLLKSAKSNRPN